MILSAAIEMFLKEAIFADKTLSNYRHDLGVFLRYTGDCKLHKLSIDKVNNYIKNGDGTECSKFHVIVALKSMLRYFTETKDFNILKPSKIKFKEPPRIPIPHTTETKIFQILKSLYKKDILTIRNRALIHTLYCTGARASEIINIKLSSVNFETRQINILHGKGDKNRTVFFTEKCSRDIQNYLSKRTDNYEYLFTAHTNRMNPDGRLDSSTLRNLLKTYNISPHMIRKTTGKEFYKRTKDIRGVQDYLGHSKVTTTQLYTLNDQEELQKLYDQNFGKNNKVILEEYENNHLIYHFEGFVAEGYPRSKMTDAMRQAANEYLKN